MSLSPLQQSVLVLVARTHARGAWYRAARNGERVTLASLYRSGWLTRRAWRDGKCSADNAHEYRIAPDVHDAVMSLGKAKEGAA